MLQMIRIEGKVRRSVGIEALTDEMISAAYEKFYRKKAEGLISGEYYGDVWTFRDEDYTTNINFSGSSEILRGLCKKVGADYERFINTLRFFAITLHGFQDLCSIRCYVSSIIKQAVKSDMYTRLDSLPDTSDSSALSAMIEFLRLYDWSLMEYRRKLEHILTDAKISEKNQKGNEEIEVLNEFPSYLKFDYVLKVFWNSCDNNEKCYYFPLYLFWMVTMIIPLRVKEFCRTAYDCLLMIDGHYYLRLRRTHLKGGGSRYHTYTTDGDYDSYTYAISRDIYELIDEYRQLVKNYNHNYNRLFSAQFMEDHSKNPTAKKTSPNSTFCPKDLNNILKNFYADIMIEQYGYQLVSENDLVDRYVKTEDYKYELLEDEVMMIRLKHTRHLSLITLIMRGANPTVIKDFAAHADSLMTEHYYGNVSKIIKCTAKYYYELYKHGPRERKERPLVVFSPFIDSKNAPYVQLDNGQCYSPSFVSGNFCDCKKVNGRCEDCHYFKGKIPLETNKIESEIDEEVQLIIGLLKNKDLDQKFDEYCTRMLRVQSKMARLSTYYWNQLNYGGR